MQKVLLLNDIEKYAEYIDEKVIAYVKEGQIHTFESFENFDLMAFEWYDVNCEDTETSQILIYLDREDLFLFGEDQRSMQVVKDVFIEEKSNEHALYSFFANLTKCDMDYLEHLEDEICETENAQMEKNEDGYLGKIVEYRKELLRLKRYYEQLDDIIDNLTVNDNKLLPKDTIRHLTIMGNRTERLRTNVLNLRDYVTQMRDAYQAQIDIEQNNLMRIFTVITAVFLPLTLMVGWYGMNFKYMPELEWQYSYPVFIVVSVLVCIVLLIIFKKKKWF